MANRRRRGMTRTAIVIGALLLIGAIAPARITGQAPQGGRRGDGPGGGRGAAPVVNLPTVPTAVTLPTLSAEITGPGPMYDSTPSLPAGKGLAAFKYELKEYFVSGTANGQPYTTRLVVRRSANARFFSRLGPAGTMPSSGGPATFAITCTYT